MRSRALSFPKERHLLDLSEAVQHCNICSRLCERTKVLSPANGAVDSRIMFVAEAPGRLGADRTRIPLYGDKTGDNFGALLEAARWERSQVFVTNAVLCNPRNEDGNNATPSQEETRNCARYLTMAISLVDPDVVISLGATALSALSYIAPHSLSLRNDVATITSWANRLLVPLYHPGPRALIHRPLASQLSDFRKLAEVMNPSTGLDPEHSPCRALLNGQTPSRFAQLIAAIVQQLGRLTYFKLTKLLYLADYRALVRLGHTITGETYIRQKEGPWPPELPRITDEMKGNELIVRFVDRLPVVSVGASPRFEVELGFPELDILVDVLRDYGQLNNARIKTAAYQTAPMRHILREELGGRSMINKPVLYKNKSAADL